MEDMISKSSARRWGGWLILIAGLLTLLIVLLLLRLSIVTDYAYHALVKDPERQIPEGRNIVSPADGTILYIKEINNGILPDLVKEDVSLPLKDLIKTDLVRPLEKGYLIGIYMNTDGVHINRAPTDGLFEKQIVFNGPHMSMTEMEKSVILTKLIPGLVTVKKLLGLEPFSIEKNGDYILKSARETLIIKENSGMYLYIIRIADYWVGNILTWIQEGQQVKKGQKMGMITWGSQVDICFEYRPGLEIQVKVGDYIYAGETILATY